MAVTSIKPQWMNSGATVQSKCRPTDRVHSLEGAPLRTQALLGATLGWVYACKTCPRRASLSSPRVSCRNMHTEIRKCALLEDCTVNTACSGVHFRPRQDHFAMVHIALPTVIVISFVVSFDRGDITDPSTARILNTLALRNSPKSIRVLSIFAHTVIGLCILLRRYFLSGILLLCGARAHRSAHRVLCLRAVDSRTNQPSSVPCARCCGRGFCHFWRRSERVDTDCRAEH